MVTITQLDRDKLTLRSERNVSLTAPNYTLLIYPWFLYERLQEALAALPQTEGQCFTAVWP